MIHTSPLPDVEIPDLALTEYVLRLAAKIPERAAIIDGESDRTVTFAALADQIARFAGGLMAAGFAPGDTLAIASPNIPEYAVVFHGTAVAGGTVTTVNPTYTASEIRHQLQDSGASWLVTVPPFVATALEAIEGTDVETVHVVGEAEGATPLANLFGEPAVQQPVDPSGQIVVLPYSSGTTGLPKGVMLTHRNLVANLCQCDHVMSFEDDEVALAVLPFFHIYGMQVLMNLLLANGVTVVTMTRFDMGQALRLIEEHRITRFYAVPPIVLGLAKSPVVDEFDLSSIKQVFSGAAPLGAELAAEASKRLGCEVIQGYGMTELSPVSHCTVEGQFKAGTVGVTVSNTETRIVDPESGEDLGIDQDGEIWVRGPQVMVGYLNNQEATDDTIDNDGWLHTGDIGRIDSDGHLAVVDRLKELIKYNGFQVPPAELEDLLLSHPDVVDVAVIGVPDEKVGELPKAFITPRPGTQPTISDIQDFVADQVASYKQIRLVELIDEIPKSASGKILRRLLRDRSVESESA